ncbi:MAG: hypothetical protein PHC84_03380 [Clostridia bacterium]|nr:hypothetical protein [Clostridia bacterium]
MGAYKRIVGLAVGMSLVLAFSMANDILTRHHSVFFFSPHGFYNAAVHATLGFIEKCIMALLIV